MSVIEKMSIMGIRSFGPEDQNKGIIEFFTPLTLILGPNGSGKTTIIECLRYMTTGDTPPNTDRGSSFVHDPKIAGETEVKGQVKLQLQDVLDKKVIATRNLLVTQKQKKLQLKTLEGTITRYSASGDKSSLSSKCAEIDKELISALGVSKPILNHVIFCHQEESNWPLSEGKALKQKFDEIFAATRYIKALEEIKKIRTEKVAEVKQFKNNATYLQENKRKAVEFSSKLERTETQLTACRDIVKNIEENLEPIRDQLTEVAQKEQHIARLNADLESTKKLLQKYERDEKSLRDSIENIFLGTKEELRDEMTNFNNSVQQKKKQLEKVKKKCSDTETEKNNLLKVRSTLLEQFGQLKTEHKQHEQRIASRDVKLGELSNLLGLGDISHGQDEPLRESQVLNVLRNWRQKVQSSEQDLKDVKGSFENKEHSIQSEIDNFLKSISQKKQKHQSSTEKLEQNGITIRNINSELSEADSLARRQDDLKADLADAESELASVENQIDTPSLRKKITELQRKKNEIDRTVKSLNQERDQLHKESKLRAEIDLITKEKTAKQDIIDKILMRQKDTIVHLIGEMPPKNAQDNINKFVNLLSKEVGGMNKTLDKKRSQLSSEKTSKSFHVEELKKKKEQLSLHKAKILEVCGNQNFDEGYDVLEKTVKELQDEKGALTGSLHLYDKYIEKLNNRKPCCPLCSRGFQKDDEAKALIKDLQQKLKEVPNQLSKKEKLIDDHQKKLNSMLELKPLKFEIVNITENEIPKLQEKINKVSDTIESLTEDVNNMEDALDSKQCDIKTATSTLPDLAILDQNQRDLERAERRLSTLTCQLGSGVARTVQQVSAEINSLQSEMEQISKDIDSDQQRIIEHGDLVQRLRSQINDLRTERVEISSRLQKKNSLEEQLTVLTAENFELNELIKELKTSIVKLEKDQQELFKKKRKISEDKERELEQMRIKISKEEKELEFVDKLTKDINNYITEGKERKLGNHEQKISSVNENIDNKSEEISGLRNDEKKLTKEVSTQQIKYREYEDNKRMMEMDEEITSYKEKCRKLENDVGSLDVRSFMNKKRQLIEQERKLTKELNENEGRQGELKKQVVDLRKQLQDKIYKDAEKKYRDMLIDLKTTEITCDDLNKYYIALDRAVMKYHQMKMDEINKILRDLWIKTYSGNDIDYIEIRSNEDESESGLEKSRRVYNYRVTMVKGDKVMDLRGRCSAGQKVLASLLIRLALAEVFCLNCGILALDEPTTNLDRDNICNLAKALVEIVQSRSEQRNFQLIIITHDEDFIDLLGRSETVDYFYKVSKDANSCSKISKCRLSEN